MGSVDAILQAKKVIESNDEPVIVVTSAMSGVTDQLIAMSQMASKNDIAYAEVLEKMRSRHLDVVERLVLPARQAEIRKTAETLLEELGNILKGVYLIGDLSAKTTNAILSYGERLSSQIIGGSIEGMEWHDARGFIKTNPHHSKHVVDLPKTEELIRREFADAPERVIVPGFISSDAASGDTTTLGRGGSDYTAALIAAALDASVLEIWTDVDGFMTADPRVINSAYVIDRPTFVEAMELCNFGAKVIYPPTIFPAYHKNIPIKIKNTFNPGAEGTFISGLSAPGEEPRSIKGISSINDTALITIQGLGMVGVIGVNYRIFKALAKNGISVFFVSQAASENTTSIGVKNADAPRAIELLEEEFAQEIGMGEINRVKCKYDLATVAIVGQGMKNTPGVAGKLFDTLGRNGINIIACAQGASETNISFVVSLDNLRKSLNVIHDSFFLSEYKVLNIFIAGIGLVGSNLLEQIRQQQEKLKRENGLWIKVVGIANSRRFITDREGIDLTGYREKLEQEGRASSLELYSDEITGMNIFNSVFVDCTADPRVAPVYKKLLEHNVSVVAANKVAASSDYSCYAELKNIARQRGIKYLFETNVGAGLPIINTINSLINSGDKILKIEAVVSGTLNYLFNEMNEDVPMSRAIRMAKEEGYAEPDPRLDLNGMDVVRKLVILSREAGYRVEQSDVEKHLFLDDKYFEGSVEDFWKHIPEVDAEWEARRKKMAAEGKKWRFVAVMDHGKLSVSLREVGASSPFYDLEGSNNVVLITTDRYNRFPLQVKGYGAGASVTAAGVFADIISIANIR